MTAFKEDSRKNSLNINYWKYLRDICEHRLISGTAENPSGVIKSLNAIMVEMKKWKEL